MIRPVDAKGKRTWVIGGQTSSPIWEEVIDLPPVPKSQGEGDGVEFQRRKRGGAGALERLVGLLARPEKRSEIFFTYDGGIWGEEAGGFPKKGKARTWQHVGGGSF